LSFKLGYLNVLKMFNVYKLKQHELILEFIILFENKFYYLKFKKR